MDEIRRLRFPPSPTGRLHIGNVRTALYNWLVARRVGGAFVLRIEDTDVVRSTMESEERLLEDLRWLGLDWDEGPDIGGPHAPYRQSERIGTFRRYARRLIESGKAYHCFCSPEQLKAGRERALAEGRTPGYSGACRSIAPDEAERRIEKGEPAAIRFKVEEGPAIAWRDLVHGELSFGRDVIGDFVVVRSGGIPAYNFAVTVDDALMNITNVIRGDDHISNTPKQLLIQDALGFPRPEYAHLPLILGSDRSKLSKRHGSTAVSELKKEGYLPEALINFMAFMGWNPGDEREIYSLASLTKEFSLEKIQKGGAVFNIKKLDFLNGFYIRQKSLEKLAESCLFYLMNVRTHRKTFYSTILHFVPLQQKIYMTNGILSRCKI